MPLTILLWQLVGTRLTIIERGEASPRHASLYATACSRLRLLSPIDDSHQKTLKHVQAI